MHSVEAFFFLSSEWEGGKISWQEKVRTYFSRHHLSCTRIFSCCQGAADIWQILFFKLSFFCPNGLPQSLLKSSSIFALKGGGLWHYYEADLTVLFPNSSRGIAILLVTQQKCCVLKSEAAHSQAPLAQCSTWNADRPNRRSAQLHLSSDVGCKLHQGVRWFPLYSLLHA